MPSPFVDELRVALVAAFVIVTLAPANRSALGILNRTGDIAEGLAK